MTKRVFRYFFDFTDGQEKWLNEMAVKGWRLVKCGQISYVFESCKPGEYEYAVEFVAHKSYSKSKDYKEFLEGMGYKAFYKNINIGIYVGKVQWRPWGEGAGQITTAPGSYQKELIIVEKAKDGKPFDLHTDLSDSLAIHRKIRTVYSLQSGGMLALAAMFLAFTIWLSSAYMALGAVLLTVFGLLWMVPAINASQKVKSLKDYAKTNELEIRPAKKRLLNYVAVVLVLAVMGTGLFWAFNFGGIAFDSYSARWKVETSWTDRWNVSYSYLNGFRQRSISLGEGTHTFTIEITTESGEINLSITGKDGAEYLKETALPTSTFEVQVEGKERVTIRIDAVKHDGGYKIRWN